MLMLGLVIHAGQCYFMPGELRDSELWYFYDSTGSEIMAPLCGVIHVYRMPIFFMLAGFFAALLMAKRGIRGLIRNRFDRIALPLAASLILIVPLIYYASEFAWSQRGATPVGFGVDDGFKGMFCDNLYHFWFLWFLLIFYSLTAIVVRASAWVKAHSSYAESLLSRFAIQMELIIKSDWGVVLFAGVSIVFLVPMNGLPGVLETSYRFIPPWYLLGIYGLCYWYGWQLFGNRERLELLSRGTHLRIFIAVIFVAIYMLALGYYLKAGKPTAMISGLIALSAISIWALVEGWLAFFGRYFHSPSPTTRYVSDSSYWVYLIHVPVMLVCQGWVANMPIVAELKFLICLSVSIVICLLSYHFLVRATWVGRFLNGRTYPIWPFHRASFKEENGNAFTSESTRHRK